MELKITEILHRHVELKRDLDQYLDSKENLVIHVLEDNSIHSFGTADAFNAQDGNATAWGIGDATTLYGGDATCKQTGNATVLNGGTAYSVKGLATSVDGGTAYSNEGLAVSINGESKTDVGKAVGVGCSAKALNDLGEAKEVIFTKVA